MNINKYINFFVVFNNNRLNWLFNSILITFIILSGRLIYLHIISASQLIHEGDKRSLRVQNICEPRGMITDRMGKILAGNISVNSIWIDPQKVNECGGIYYNVINWKRLSDILEIPLEKILFFLENYPTRRFLYLARQVDSMISKYISQLQLPGVYLQQELKRYYPSGPVTAHLVGITDIDNQGIEGVEKSFNFWLSGSPKTKIVRKDRLGRIIENTVLLDSGRLPKNVILSIDERLQYFAYHELNKAVNMHHAESGSIVLIDIKTGEILVMVNIPSYNPNNFFGIDQSVMRNRAITDVFEPGSTIKPIVIMTALQHKIIERDTVINTLPYTINGHQIKDVSFHQMLTISEILQKSSNVGVSKIALAMPISVLVNAYLSFGIGKLTDIGLVGENKGKIHLNYQYYSAIEHAALSYGYGVMLTPLQLAKIYATIGNMGVSRPISIIKVDQNSADFLGNQIFPKSLVRNVIDMMTVTTLSGPNYHRAAVNGYYVAIKTGTVKKIGSYGKYVNKYISYIAGIAPAGDPKLALVVMINEPKNGCYYGGLVAAPVFKSVMSSALTMMNIRSDFLE